MLLVRAWSNIATMDGPEKEKMHKIQFVVFLPKIAGYYSNDFKRVYLKDHKEEELKENTTI